jgi:hypothetical protein
MYKGSNPIVVAHASPCDAGYRNGDSMNRLTIIQIRKLLSSIPEFQLLTRDISDGINSHFSSPFDLSGRETHNLAAPLKTLAICNTTPPMRLNYMAARFLPILNFGLITNRPGT